MAAKAQDSEEYSGLEIDNRFLQNAEYSVPNTKPSVLPQVYDDNLPEVHQADTKGHITTAEPSQNATKTVCGISRKTFWVVLGVIAVVVIAGAVGGGLGARSQQSSQATPSKPLPSVPANPKDVLRESKLAAVNFTDSNGHSNYFVYYQKNSNELFESTYNSSLGKWTTSRVGNDTFRRGTEISANIFRFDAAARNMHTYAVRDNGYLTGWIRNINDTSQAIQEWGTTLYQFGVPLNGSRILSYGREDDQCLTKNILVFQEGGGEVLFNEFKGNRTMNSGGVGAVPQPILRTGLTFVPIYGAEGTNKSLAMFDVVSGAESPRYIKLSVEGSGDDELNIWKTTKVSGQYELDESASITGFSVGSSQTGDILPGSGSDMTVRLLILEAGKAVSTVSFRDGVATDGGEVKGIGSEGLLSIAACQGRRVYGIVAKDDGTVKIVEWEWMSDNQYKEVGEVNTTMEEE